jgi:malate synthase
MTVPFMRAYTELLVKTCHRRQAHAIGGMAAFIPSRRDPAVNASALGKVREDKRREAEAGYDGAWVAHPDLVPIVQEIFDGTLDGRPHQKERQREEVEVSRGDLLDVRVPGGTITEAGVQANIEIALQYLAAWLGGSGAVGINNLMEDTATAEISRAQLWQWVRQGAVTETGRAVTLEWCRAILREAAMRQAAHAGDAVRTTRAAELLDQLIGAAEFPEFLTLIGYEQL